MLIYPDLCCLDRPFDDQSQLVIRLQTEAKLHIQHEIRQGGFALVWSAAMDLEDDANPDLERRDAMAAWKSVASVDVEDEGRYADSGGRSGRLRPCNPGRKR